MSSNRAGRVVRCPECKTAIRIPQIELPGVSENEVISCRAKIAQRKRPQVPLPGTDQPEVLHDEDSTSRFVSTPKPIMEAPEIVETPSRLVVPAPAAPPTSETFLDAETNDNTDPFANADSLHLDVLSPKAAPKPEPVTSNPTIVADSHVLIDTDTVPISTYVEKDWEQRLESANADRRVLARFFAICMCVVAIVNMVPALYHWFHWTQLTDNASLPRWIYIQVFVGAIYLIYAVFLAQIPDWSALRSVALAMLAMAFVFGFVSTGLLVGGGQGSLTGFLGIPYALNREACIWCVAMLCLATLMAYWGGKESLNWQRAEALLKEILNRNPAQA